MTLTLIITGLLIVGFSSYMYYTYKKIKNTPEVETHSSIIELSDANFAAQVKTGVTLVDFWASWCMPCKMMAPILNEVAGELGTTAKVAKLDVETHRSSSAKYGVRNIPTLILFKNGKEINRFVGVKTKSFLVSEINKIK
jgi:thioredoxin 1